MKPFLLLATRPEDDAAREELEGFLRAGELPDDGIHQIRVDRRSLPAIDLDDYSGVLLGGGPFNSSDPQDEKPAEQLRFEAEVAPLLDEMVDRDFPFLGACLGIGVLGTHLGGLIDRTYSEEPSVVNVALTDEGRRDPLFEGISPVFEAIVGHKEACSRLPEGAVLLATASACPVQAFRFKTNLYVTQFHPELDIDSVVNRVTVYRDAGYFPSEEYDRVVAAFHASNPEEPALVMRNFVRRYART